MKDIHLAILKKQPLQLYLSVPNKLTYQLRQSRDKVLRDISRELFDMVVDICQSTHTDRKCARVCLTAINIFHKALARNAVALPRPA